MKRMARTRKIAAGVGAALLAAGAAAGYYYFYASKDAKRNRKIAAKWASDMKRDVMREISRLSVPDREAVRATIGRIAGAYQAARGVDPQSVSRAARELKDHWHELVLSVRPRRAPRAASKGRAKQAAARTGTAAKKRARR